MARKAVSDKWIKKLEDKYKNITVVNKELFEHQSIRNTFLRVVGECSHHPHLKFKRTYENLMKTGCPICKAFDKVEDIKTSRSLYLGGFKLSLNEESIKKHFEESNSNISVHVNCKCPECSNIDVHLSTDVLKLGRGKYSMKCTKCKYTSNPEKFREIKPEKEFSVVLKNKEALNEVLVEMEMLRSEFSKEINNLPYDVYARLSMALSRPQVMLKHAITDIFHKYEQENELNHNEL